MGKCLRGHDTDIVGRSRSRYCMACHRDRNREWMRKYRSTERGKEAFTRYNQSTNGRLRNRVFQESSKRKRYELIYNRTGRYSRNADEFIDRMEKKLASYSTN